MMDQRGAGATLSLCGNTPPHFRAAALAAEDLPFGFGRLMTRLL